MTEHIRAVVIDIEGTAAPVTFVTEVLFPFARARLDWYLETHADDPIVVEALTEAGSLVDAGPLSPQAAAALFRTWMDEDRKATPLKTIQGLIWEEGYADGAIRGELYSEVPDRLAAWAAAGKRLFIYSSGSERAQRLLFGHTADGDLTPLFEGFFDTRIGPKTSPSSYGAILDRIRLPGDAVIFLSDSEAELDAAAAAGLRTARLARDGAVESRHAVHRDFLTIGI
jgi:enolase-phosphatase E1